MGCGGGGAVLASSFYISLSLFIIVRAFSGLSQALLIAQPAQHRRGKEGRERGKRKRRKEDNKSIWQRKEHLPEQKDLYLLFF
jgi:hypothetical protein